MDDSGSQWRDGMLSRTARAKENGRNKQMPLIKLMKEDSTGAISAVDSSAISKMAAAAAYIQC